MLMRNEFSLIIFIFSCKVVALIFLLLKIKNLTFLNDVFFYRIRKISVILMLLNVKPFMHCKFIYNNDQIVTS